MPGQFMFDQIISKYGATAKAKLSSPAITGAPEDNIRAPLEELITALAMAAGQQPGWVTLVGESTLSALGTRPDYAVTVRSALTGFIELKAPGKGADPRKFTDPDEFRIDRPNAREHIAFGRGIHTCAGAPLARVEGQITVRRMLDRMRDIAIDESVHGPAGGRNYTYEPTFLLRGLTHLNITWERA